MNQNNSTQLSKNEKRALVKKQMKDSQRAEKRKGWLTRAALILLGVVVLAGFGYLWFSANPTGPTSATSAGLDHTTTLKLGSLAPNFKISAADGKTVSLSDYSGKNVLLYFQEGLMCQPCWKQIGTLNQDLSLFAKINTDVVAIGVDSASEWQPILKAEQIDKVPVLVDESRTMSSSYGVLSMSSQMHSDRPGHTFVLVDKDRKVRWIADYPTMRVSDEEIFNSVKEALQKQT